MTPLLQARGLSLSFGRLEALSNVDLLLGPGERHALIGPNGAGKTSLLNVLTGMLDAHRGHVLLDGQDVTRWSIDQRTRAGLVRTFQISSLFPSMTASATLALAICEREGLAGQWWRAISTPKPVLDEAAYWLERIGLAGVSHVPAAHLPHGQQRLLEIALALACRPRVLLLDEPAAGLSIAESHALLDVIHSLPEDVAVLLIEHDMKLVFGFAQTISVLAHGKLVACGPPDRIAADDQVRALYLGDA